jgi:hypothetical protein
VNIGQKKSALTGENGLGELPPLSTGSIDCFRPLLHIRRNLSEIAKNKKFSWNYFKLMDRIY